MAIRAAAVIACCYRRGLVATANVSEDAGAAIRLDVQGKRSTAVALRRVRSSAVAARRGRLHASDARDVPQPSVTVRVPSTTG